MWRRVRSGPPPPPTRKRVGKKERCRPRVTTLGFELDPPPPQSSEQPIRFVSTPMFEYTKKTSPAHMDVTHALHTLPSYISKTRGGGGCIGASFWGNTIPTFRPCSVWEHGSGQYGVSGKHARRFPMMPKGNSFAICRMASRHRLVVCRRWWFRRTQVCRWPQQTMPRQK